MIGGGRGKTKADVKVELLVMTNLERCARMHNVLGTAAFGKLTAIFDKGVPWAGDLTIE